MGELMVTIKVSEEDVIMLPYVQAIAIGKCCSLIHERTGRQPMWHPGQCGCCYHVHARPPEGEIEHSGYVVGADGGYSFHDVTEEG